MMEVGPWRMHDDGQFYVEEGGWEEYTNVVYGACTHTGNVFWSNIMQSINLLEPGSHMRLPTNMFTN